MSDFDRPGVAGDGPVKRRSAGSRVADLGDRLAQAFGSVDRTNADLASWETNGDSEDPVVGETAPLWDPVAPRFPTARRGYDRAAVDQHVTELERELAELRAHTPLASTVAAEIERIGEQAAAILRVAHDQAQETTRRAQAQADRCLANATSNAVAITEEANRQLSQLDSETDSVWRERARLIEDARNVATALLSLAQDAADRFPAEPEKVAPPAPAASEPTGEHAIYGQLSEPDGT